MDNQRTGGHGPKCSLSATVALTTPAPQALLLADIEDMRAVFGPEVRITIPTINPANLRRYVQEGPDLRIASMPTISLPRCASLSKKTT